MYGSYNTTAVSEKPLTQIACYALVGLAIIFGAMAFWSKGAVPAVLLTTAMACLSFLLSGVVLRFAEALSKGHRVTAGLAVAMGFVCLACEASMTHYGLEHLNAQYSIAPAWALWPASFGLSLFNVFSVYSFARELPAHKPRIVVKERTERVDDFLGAPGSYAAHDARMTKWEDRVAQDPERVKAADPKTADILATIGRKVIAGAA